jgi:hypothetical protein
LSDGTCRYIRMCINTVADSAMLYLRHDFYNIIFKIKHKLHIASGLAPSPPPPRPRKNFGCAPVWDVRLCSLVDKYWRFGGTCCPYHHSFTLKMEVAGSPDTGILIYQSTWRYIPEGSNIYVCFSLDFAEFPGEWFIDHIQSLVYRCTEHCSSWRMQGLYAIQLPCLGTR